MSIRFRLIISYIAMLVVPLVLSLVVGSIIIGFNMHYISGKEHFLSPNPGTQLVQQAGQVFPGIKTTADKEPDKLKNIKYLNELDNSLMAINTGIVVRENNTVIYSSNILSGTGITEQLPQFGAQDEDLRDPRIIDNRMYLIRQHDFYFKNNQPGSVFLITDVSLFGHLARKIIFSISIAVILILIFTNGILTYMVSRSIIKPVDYLRNAAGQIKEGNLNFRIKYDQKDEISKLAEAMEEMRCQLKKSLDQQLQYEDNRKELISSISHDLKTPITAIKGYVEGIMDGVADSPQKLDKYIKTIYVKANDLDKQIDELFLFSKLDLKKLPFDFEEVNINEYLRDCVEEMRFDLEKDNILIDSTINNIEPIMVVADREKLKRVIINIFQNAAKYMNQEFGKILVSLAVNDCNVTIKIQDNGQGISEQALPNIFDRFYRVEPSRNSSTGGSGLGLAIAKRIIEEHGGQIWAESSEGLGTSIFFTLKRVKPREMIIS